MRVAKVEGSKRPAIGLDKELAAEVSSRLVKIKELQAQLKIEVADAAKAKEKLR